MDLIEDLRDALRKNEELRIRLSIAADEKAQVMASLEAERVAWSLKAAELFNEIDTLRGKLYT